MNLEIHDSSFPSAACSLAHRRKLYQIALCCQAASPACSPARISPAVVMPLALPSTLLSTSKRPPDLRAALTRNAEQQAGPRLRCCPAAKGIPHRQQPDSSAFLHWVGGLGSHSAGTHPALRPHSAQQRVRHPSEQPAIPATWLTDNLTCCDSSNSWGLLSVSGYTRGSGQEHLGLLCIALVLLWNKAAMT